MSLHRYIFVVTALLTLGASAIATFPTATAQDTKPKDQVVLGGERVRIAEIAAGSWCPGGENLLAEGEKVELSALTILLTEDEVQLNGKFKKDKAKRKHNKYEPEEFDEEPDTETLRARDLKKGVDVEIAGADGKGMAVIRIEQNWRGVVWGVLSGWEFELEEENITLVDADLNGECSEDDRVIYGERGIWMPWHTVTVSGNTIYHELEITGPSELTSRRQRMKDRGTDATVWDEWQAERKDQGVPPGLFSQKLQQACVKHAQYCQMNKYMGHEEEEGKPGYSKEGHQAGKTSCISFSGSKTAMWLFLDSLYHLTQIIDPRTVVLQLGGNQYAYLMGFDNDPDLPNESRSFEQPQLHPAPYSKVPHNAYSYENPEHPIYSQSKKPGLPVIVRVGNQSPSFSDVDCHLYEVSGDMKTGERGDEVRCHLSHAGKDTPEGFPTMWSMVALTPYRLLKFGAYEADFRFKEGGEEHHLTWRFEIGR